MYAQWGNVINVTFDCNGGSHPTQGERFAITMGLDKGATNHDTITNPIKIVDVRPFIFDG